MCTPVVGNRESLVLKGTVGFYWRKPLFLAKSIKFILPKLPWLLTWFQQAHLRRTTEASQEVDAGPLRVVLTDSRTRPLTPLLPLVRPMRPRRCTSICFSLAGRENDLRRQVGNTTPLNRFNRFCGGTPAAVCREPRAPPCSCLLMQAQRPASTHVFQPPPPQQHVFRFFFSPRPFFFFFPPPPNRMYKSRRI